MYEENTISYEASKDEDKVCIVVRPTNKPSPRDSKWDSYYVSAIYVRGSEGIFLTLKEYEGCYKCPDEACRSFANHFDWFHDNGIDMSQVTYCDNTLRALKLK